MIFRRGSWLAARTGYVWACQSFARYRTLFFLGLGLRCATRCLCRHFFVQFLLEHFALIARECFLPIAGSRWALELGSLEFAHSVSASMNLRQDVVVAELQFAEFAHTAKHRDTLLAATRLLESTGRALVCLSNKIF